ncbi:MAG: PilZ domain-containing protein [Thermodesulfobacteriota bacterium]
MTESRRYERFNLAIPATIMADAHDESGSRGEMNLLTSDICAGGAYFHTDCPLPEGTPVKVELILAIDKLKKLKGRQAHVLVEGRVVRTGPQGMAVCFEPNYKINSLESNQD